jgi:hypothetical protein
VIVHAQVPPGGALEAYPIGFQAHGLVIDNRSGSWLYVVETNAFVKPYTLQWTRLLSPAQSVISIRSVASPSGTASINSNGSPSNVTFTDVSLVDSDGSTYFTPVDIPTFGYASGSLALLLGPGVNAQATPNVAGIPGVQIRLLQITLAVNEELVSTIAYSFTTTFTYYLLRGQLNQANPAVNQIFSRILRPGDGIGYSVTNLSSTRSYHLAFTIQYVLV